MLFVVIRCVHRFDWRKKHAQVINESTSHLFFSFTEENRIASHRSRRWYRAVPRRVVGSCARGVTRIRKKNAGEENDDDAREEEEEHEYYKY